MNDLLLDEIDGKFYATAEAYIVESPKDLPREMASAFPDKGSLNPSFLWVAGRFVQANRANKNGHFWSYDDLQVGEASIRHTPMNVLHKWNQPVGTFVETKIVHRKDKLETASDALLPEIQALGVLWAANFPAVAAQAKTAHAAKQLWYSMECVAEKKQCLQCDQVFEFAAKPHETCAHLAERANAPRRFINPTFLGGALIFPPEAPAWQDADVTEMAHLLVDSYAHREERPPVLGSDIWEAMMDEVVSSVPGHVAE